MKLNQLRLAFVLIAAGHCGAVGAAEPAAHFEMRGWQFHEYDVPKVDEAIRRAPDYGVNFVIFSHELFRSVEGFVASGPSLDPAHPPAHVSELRTPRHFKLVPGWQADINRLGARAAERGIAWYLWIHEFDDLPRKFFTGDNRVNMDHPELMGYIDQRYQRLVDAAPGTTGFCLTFHESDRKPFRDTEVASALPVPERLEKIVNVIHGVARRNGKKLILRNFFYEPREMEQFATALARMPDDVIVMSKTTVHEFHPFYPPRDGETRGHRADARCDPWHRSRHGTPAQHRSVRPRNALAGDQSQPRPRRRPTNSGKHDARAGW